MNYKGFDKDLKCRGFQYEIGKEYEMDEPIAICKNGFHACEAPLDVFNYYPPATSRFCEVEQSGELRKDDSDSKVVSSKIKIGAEIGIPGLVNAQIEWVKKTIGYDKAIENARKSPDEISTGYWGAASATGVGCVALAAGKDCTVKGALGCAIFAVERGDFDGNTYPIISVASAVVDGTTIKADTWYRAKNGCFEEVT